MDKKTKMRLIVVIVIAIALGLFVVGVTAKTITQYRQRCHDWDSSQDRENSTPYPSQGCCGRQYRSCWNLWPFS